MKIHLPLTRVSLMVGFAFFTGNVHCCSTDRYRLNGGTNSSSGYLEVLRNNTWYKVCMNDWSVENGNSMCQQMGFPGVRGFSSPIPVDEPDQTIVKYRTFASCKGSEKCLTQCEGHSWEVAPYFEPSPNGVSFCYRNEDQMLICKEDEDSPDPDYVTKPDEGTSVHSFTTVVNPLTTAENDTERTDESTTVANVGDMGHLVIGEGQIDTARYSKNSSLASTITPPASSTQPIENSTLRVFAPFDFNNSTMDEELNIRQKNSYNASDILDYFANKSYALNSRNASSQSSNVTDNYRDVSGYKYFDKDVPGGYETGCPGYESTFSGNSLYGQISSPNFKGRYPNNARCSWNIQVDPTKTIQLTINDFQTQKDKDVLKMYKNGIKTPSYTLSGPYLAQTSQNRASGTNDSVILDIDSSSVTFDFRTDGSVTDRGFKIEYKAVPEAEKEQSIGEILNGPSVPAWALGVLALFLIIVFACIFGLWKWKSQSEKDKENRSSAYEKSPTENGEVVRGGNETPQEDYESTYSLPGTLGGRGAFTSGKISAIDTNSGAQFQNRMGHSGSQRRVAFQNTAFSKDPSLWEVNEVAQNATQPSSKKSPEARHAEFQYGNSSSDSTMSFDQHHMNNNNNTLFDNRGRNRPRTNQTIFTASEFLNQPRPKQNQDRGETEPRASRLNLHQHERKKVSIASIDDGGFTTSPMGTIDLVLAIPYTPNDKLKEPTLISDEHRFNASPATISLPTHPSSPKPKSGAYNDISTRPNMKYSVNSNVGGQRFVDWDLSTTPRDFVCPITHKLMKHPVTGPDGVTYEKGAIFDWLERHNSSPVTKQPMSSDEIKPDGMLKARIREWKLQMRNQKQKIEKTAGKSPNTLLGDVQC